MAASPGGGVAAAGLPDLLSLVASLDTTLLPCLPARELQAADRSTHPSHQGFLTPALESPILLAQLLDTDNPLCRVYVHVLLVF